MSIINNGLLLASGADAAVGYQISRSIRLNAPDSAYFSRTPSSAGNRKTWTWSAWVKRSGLGSNLMCLADARTGSNESPIIFGESVADTLSFYQYTSGFDWQLRTTQVFRDVGAWFHLVVAVDTTQATAANRIKIYLNGSQITTFAVANYPSQNADTFYNSANVHTIGAKALINSYFDGYLADIYLLDGTATDPSTFAETDAVTGQWVPKTPTGISYGTNGFKLTFSDNSGTTSTTLGKDAAGSNNWTPNNFSVASGSGNDSLVDTPTSYGTDTGAGGEVRGNYAVFNALALNGNTLSNGNLDYLAGSANKPTLTTVGIPNTGKWYFEFTDVNSTGSFTAGVGTASVGVSSYLGADANGWGYQTHPTNAGYHNSGVFTTTGRINGAGSNTIVGVAIDRDAQKIWFSVNGTYVNSGVPASGTNAQYSNLPSSGELFPGASTGSGQNIVFNAGQRAFAYTAPSGFKALCTANLTAPGVTKPSTVMDVVLYTGTGSSLTLPYASSTPTIIAFTPDLVWIKGRSGATDHALYDAVRDVQKDLASNSTAAETTQSTGLTAFGTNTFTIGSLAKLNTSSATYAAWCWDAGSSTDTNNTAGTITPTGVRANATAGFSIVTWTGNATLNASIGHGLGAVPRIAFIKNRSTTTDWLVYTTLIDGTADFLKLNTTAAKADLSSNVATSTLYYLDNGSDMNGNGNNMVGYFFAPVVGYSSFGSYTGNGSSTDGPFVYTGFRPRWVLIKSSSNVEDWKLYDTARDAYNLSTSKLYPNLSAAENGSSGETASTNTLDVLSNGFKLRTSNSGTNASSATYIYIAFAESPFNYSRAR